MKVIIRSDSVDIEGYVNLVERNSKVLYDRTLGKFIERIKTGAFTRALERNDDVHVLLNHDPNRDLGSQKQGNLELVEDPIGLFARTTITDPETMEDAKNGNLVGWSFGFTDVPDGVVRGIEDDIPLRKLNDLNLIEVSILNRKRVPAYEGTLIYTRSEDEEVYHSEEMEDVEYIREEEPKQPEAVAIDYSNYEQMIAEMKGE